MRQWLIDAFAAEPFKGNPACVVAPLDAWPDAAWMQRLAAENNQAETAFLLKTDAAARFGLRWFTPAIEVPLCGHATLASAHALYGEIGLAADEVIFDTLSGPLIVRRQAAGYEMDFPARPPRRMDPPAGLAEALGFTPAETWVSQFLVVLAADEAQVRAARPDLKALEKIGAEASQGRGNVGVAALAETGKPYDVVSRFFAPGSGINEDPTTGSLHCILAPLFSERLGKPVLRYHQAYPGRGGDLECETKDDRVLLRGRAVTVAESTLRL